ncbi:AraC family transcriptional regulator [Paenibacillus sp. P96]|uniref:AraC family transcriptional regulator n=1 Tax=Paenibacillus zeirhizosphaerae TaxID=2987519 RepID=A0ABT9FUJ1_9BACL|nr:AraC family transcriptional regulator [Paenibacillus sp. P96]MDP4098334.1 AraC family transcriptional regulator [Paenibacillus sp. P96]
MKRPADLREPMDMPDRYFPIKLHTCRAGGEGSTLFPHHWHEHMELLYFESGEAVIECNSMPYEVHGGDLIVLNSNDLHHGICRSEQLRYYALIVDLSVLQSPSPDAIETKFIVPILQNRMLFQHRIRNDASLHACMNSIVEEFKGKEPGYELSIKSSMYRLLAILFRNYVTEAPPQPLDMSRRKNLERFTPIFEYIGEHLGDELSVHELSRMAGLSRFHFSRLFSELTGRTVSEYINQIRINKAEYLLRHTDMTISEIAWATGYNDISYFSRTFKKHKSVSASELRATSAAAGRTEEEHWMA